MLTFSGSRSPRSWWRLSSMGVAIIVAHRAHAQEPRDPEEHGEQQSQRTVDSSVVPDAPAPTSLEESVTEQTDPLFEAAAFAGFVSAPIRGGVNPFGAGFGGRIGFNVHRVYVGAFAANFLGGDDNGASDQALLAGLELGYSLPLSRFLLLRPLVGVGDTILTHTEPGTVDVVTSASGQGLGASSTTTTVKNIYVLPSVSALVSYRAFFSGLSVGALIVPGITYGPAPAQQSTWASYSVSGEIGFRL